MISLFNKFDMVRIINLPERADRRRQMNAELKRVGALAHRDLSFFAARRTSERFKFRTAGARGCFLSHLAILQEADDANKSVLILEDDCVFKTSGELVDLSSQFHLFYGGYTATDPSRLEKTEIIGSHAMGFSADGARLARAYFETLLTDDFVVDPKSLADPNYDPDMRPEVDGAYVWLRRTHPSITTIFANPPIAQQRFSKSDVSGGKWFDKIWGVRQLAGAARLAKNLFR